jgi:hypothetical protein
VSEHKLDDLTGAKLAELTGRGMSGRMVRQYLAPLTLPVKAQELAEAAGLSEKALRPIVSLASPAEQIRLVHALAEGTLTPGQVKREVARLKGQERPPASTATRFWRSLRSHLLVSPREPVDVV